VFVAAGGAHNFAFKPDRTVWSWGYNQSGQLGNGKISFEEKVPAQISVNRPWATVALGMQHSVALAADGTLWAFGNLGNSREQPLQPLPIQMGNETDWAIISSALYDTLGLKKDSSLWITGRDALGLLTMIRIGEDKDWVTTAGGRFHSAAIKSDGTLWTWGRSNEHGQAGDASVFFPGQVGLEANWGKAFLP